MATILNAVRTARRGAAPGPAGTTNEHIRLLLADGEDLRLLHAAANRLANADIPPAILQALKLGRVVALKKPNGKIRGLVVGDTFRRIVGRALARQYASQLQTACLPYQFGLSNRAGTEALYKWLQAATHLDARTTILSLDAIGAYDHVSRGAMLAGLQRDPQLAPLHAYAHQWYGAPSTYIWTDDRGQSHGILQAEGEEQGDPLMPGLFCLA
jgi:hypothetical protein